MKKEETKIIYYEDELNDEFSTVKIIPRKIEGNFKYQKSFIWELFSYITQNILSMPIKVLYLKIRFNHKFIGKEKIKKYRKENKRKGLFIYANHTQAFADTIIPSMAIYPKRNFYIVNPENISMHHTGPLIELLGAIPIPGDIKSSKNFLKRIENRIKKGYSISIYPEAHIWPYCTFIRNFKSVSFRYPKMYNVPMFTVTNTYQKRKNNKIQIVSYIDGPFYPDNKLSLKENEKKLRDMAYNNMTKRSKNSNIEKIKYIKKESM